MEKKKYNQPEIKVHNFKPMLMDSTSIVPDEDAKRYTPIIDDEEGL